MCTSKPKAPAVQPLPPQRQLARMPTKKLGAAGFDPMKQGLAAPRSTVAQNDVGQRVIGRSTSARQGTSGQSVAVGGPIVGVNQQQFRAPSVIVRDDIIAKRETAAQAAATARARARADAAQAEASGANRSR